MPCDCFVKLLCLDCRNEKQGKGKLMQLWRNRTSLCTGAEANKISSHVILSRMKVFCIPNMTRYQKYNGGQCKANKEQLTHRHLNLQETDHQNLKISSNKFWLVNSDCRGGDNNGNLDISVLTSTTWGLACWCVTQHQLCYIAAVIHSS